MVRLLRGHIEPTLRRELGGSARLRVLDVGCGGQPFRPLIEGLGHDYAGADTQNPLGIVDHLFEIDGRIPDNLAAAGGFDFILCTEVLEHVADWDRAFANFSRLLAPGGRMLLTCPFVYVLHEEPHDFWRPTSHALKHFAVKHGLDAIDVQRIGSAWDVIGTVLGASYGCVKPTWGRLDYRFTAYLVDKLLRLTFRLLQSGALQGRVSLRNDRLPLYLTNVASFHKPDAAHNQVAPPTAILS